MPASTVGLASKPMCECLQIAKNLRYHLEDVFVKYGVDVVVSGHLHAYSRTCPVIDRHCVPNEQGSIVHVIAGSAGRKLDDIGDKEEWMDVTDRAFGYSRFTVRFTVNNGTVCTCAPHAYYIPAHELP